MSAARETITIQASKQRVFEAFVEEIDLWWPREGKYRYSFAPAGVAPAHIVFEARAQGRLYERFEDGSEYVIGHIVEWDPPHRLVYTWRAPEWPSHTVVEVQFREAGGATEVTVVHRGFGENGVPERSADYTTGLGEIFMHLAIDEIYLRELIACPLLEGRKPPDGVGFLPPPPPYGLTKDVIQFWFDRARTATRRLFQAWPENPDLVLVHGGGLRLMNGLEWLHAYTGHEALHQQQINENS